ncbi:MAG: hypothetical protein MJ231_08595, partial [bacterium]|nr:hypothetical protein [bacterium]
MKTIVLYSIIGATALSLGAGGGIIYKRVIMKPKQNIIGFNPEACKPDAEALFAKIDGASSKKQATKDFPAVDIANYASEKYKTYANSVSYCYGLADTIVKQDIRNVQIKNGDVYFEEAISKSDMVGVGKRIFQQGLDGTVSLYHEKSSKDVSISGDIVHTNFKTDPERLTPNEYKTQYGRTLPDMFIYCVHEITVLNGTCEEITGGYKVVLELDPIMGGYQYRYQMKTISNLDDYPVFDSLKLTYTLDE